MLKYIEEELDSTATRYSPGASGNMLIGKVSSHRDFPKTLVGRGTGALTMQSI